MFYLPQPIKSWRKGKGLYYISKPNAAPLAATDATSGKWFSMEREWAAFSNVLAEYAQVKVTLMPDVEICQKLNWYDHDRVNLTTPP